MGDSLERIMEHYLSSIENIIEEVTELGQVDYVKFVMNFEKDVLERQRQFIKTKFKADLLDVLEFLLQDYQKFWDKKARQKMEIESIEEIERQEEYSRSEEEDEELSDDSFIDDDEEQEEGVFREVGRRFKKKDKLESKWGPKHQIDKLISNIFSQLKEN